MKPRNRLFCMILSCMLLLCGCGTKQTGPTIARTEFPEKTQRILQPLEGDTQFFDFTTDASVTAAVVTVRYCQDGTWQEPEALLELSDIQPGEYHLILRWVEDRVNAFIVEDGASYSNTYLLAPEWLEAFNASVMASTVGFGSEKPTVLPERKSRCGATTARIRRKFLPRARITAPPIVIQVL